MSMTVTLAVIWVFASTIVAFLPLHHQFRPGSLLFATAPGVIVMLALDFGALVGALACAAFLSMFRHPLRHYWGKLRGAYGVPK